MGTALLLAGVLPVVSRIFVGDGNRGRGGIAAYGVANNMRVVASFVLVWNREAATF